MAAHGLYIFPLVFCEQETKERFDLSEKWEKEKRNLTDEHKKNMNKLRQEMETEKNKLQREVDQMVCFLLCVSKIDFSISNYSRGIAWPRESELEIRGC